MSDQDNLGRQLPPTWAVARLGDLVNYGRTNKAEPEEIDDSAWVLELEDIEKDSSRLLQRVTFGERRSKSTKNRFDTGDVLYGKLRPYLNKVLIADQPGFCTTEIVPIKSSAHLDTRFLFYWLKHPAFLRYVEAESHGMNMPRLGTEAGRAAPFVIAPRAEQSRIADQLDTLLARIKACNDHLNAIPGLLKRFRRAVINAATTGALTEDWRSTAGNASDAEADAGIANTTISAIALDLRYGTSKKCDYVSTGVGVLRIPNIADHGRLDLRDLKSAEFDSGERAKLSLHEGDLLVVRSNGSLDLVGKTSVVTKAEVGLLFAGYLMRLRVNTALAVPEFIQLSLSASAQRRYIEQTAKSTSGVNNLNAEELRALKLWLPELAEQREIVSRVAALFRVADRIEANFSKTLSRTRRLAPQILAKAFRGDLLPQDPHDEPASALLARLAAERSQTSAPAKTRKARTPRTARSPQSTSSPSQAMPTKSRQEEDVKGQPYLAGHLRHLGQPVDAKTLFEASELPVADFYKQLAWEIAHGHVNDADPLLEPARHAA
ncbi:MAG: restriction endonuclease subunit S [Rhizobacter sp.]|nr:restriction endonuclease subunit S [Rhizobacter sp.]